VNRSFELGGPDICVYFLYHLLNAYMTQSAITLGKTIFPVEHVQDIVEQLDVVVLPCVNPDGRVYVERSQNWWRKNRNQGAGDGAIGVDINRNFDFLWGSGIGSTDDPSADTYRGTAAFSEPETRNVKWLLETMGANVYVDLHGPSQALVYPWGYAPDQSVNPEMSFLNPAWDGKRTPPYQAYINAGDAVIYEALGQKMVDATNQVRGSSYAAGQSYEALYPTTATSDDYAYSRNLVDSSKQKTYAYTFEYGGGTWFPEYSEMQQVAAEVNAGMIALCDALVTRVL